MNPKLLLCLTLVLSGGWFECCTAARDISETNEWSDFPILSPFTNANPSICHLVSVRVPTRLKIERTADSLSVTVDTNSFESTNLLVGSNMVIGFQGELFVYPVGELRLTSGVRMLEGGALVFNSGTVYWHTTPDGIPQVGESYIVEMDLAAFETDIPPQHMWDPYGESYKVLWRRTLKQSVE